MYHFLTNIPKVCCEKHERASFFFVSQLPCYETVKRKRREKKGERKRGTVTTRFWEAKDHFDRLVRAISEEWFQIHKINT